MPIVPSRSKEVQRLIARLASARAADRDSAAAQLRLLGERAVEPLVAALRDGDPALRREALSVLGDIGDARALPGILACYHDPDAALARQAVALSASYPDARTARALAGLLDEASPVVRRAAVEALAGLQRAGVAQAMAPLLDRLLDENEDESLRLLAFESLSYLPRKELRPLLSRLRATRSRTLAARVASLESAPATGPRVVEPANDPVALRAQVESLGRSRSAASIPVLRRLLDRLDAQPAAGGDAAAIAATKAQVHLALAALDSRVGLYDLREMLEKRPPVALAALLQAAREGGDASLVPALARLVSDYPRLLNEAAVAFTAIAGREGLRRRSRSLKAVPKEHRAGLDALWARVARKR